MVPSLLVISSHKQGDYKHISGERQIVSSSH